MFDKMITSWQNYLVDATDWKYGEGGQVLFRFPNRYGASVILNEISYGHEAGLFELAVIKWDVFPSWNAWHIDYDTYITDDVLGFLTSEDVESYLVQIMLLLPNGQKAE